MAKALQDVDEKTYTTQCSICCEKFKDPRILTCFHTFCFPCIKEYIETNAKNGQISCPVCKDTMKVPMIGALGLEKNYYVGDKKALDGRLPCDVCGEKVRASSFCYECNQNLCASCIGFHEKLQTTKDHHVAGLDESGARKVTRKPKCVHHTANELQYFCEQCEELICIDCNMTSHKLHKCKDIGEVAKFYRDELSNEISKEEYRKLLDELTDFSRSVKKNKNAHKNSEDTLIASINKQKKLFQALIDEISYDFIDAISETGNDKESLHKQQKISIEKKVHSFAAVHFFTKHMLQQADDKAIVAHAVNVKKRLDALKSMEAKPKGADDGATFVFSPGELIKEELKETFGNLFDPNDKKMEEDDESVENDGFEFVVQFTCQFSISGIASTDKATAWICMGTEALIQLFDLEGKILKQVTFSHGLDDVTFASDGILYVSSNGNKKIRTVNEKEEKGTLIRTELCCRGLAWDAENEEVVVGLSESDVFFNVPDKAKSSVLHIGLDKQIRSAHDNNKVVKYPGRLAVGKRMVFISDWVNLTVTVQNSKGQVHGVYGGKPENDKNKENPRKEDFIPRGICTDCENNVYVADAESESIHALNINGEFQNVILTKDDGLENPWWLDYSCKTGHLWVGSMEGTVRVYKRNSKLKKQKSQNDDKTLTKSRERDSEKRDSNSRSSEKDKTRESPKNKDKDSRNSDRDSKNTDRDSKNRDRDSKNRERDSRNSDRDSKNKERDRDAKADERSKSRK